MKTVIVVPAACSGILRLRAARLGSESQPQILAARVDDQTPFDYLLGRATSENLAQMTADGGSERPPLGTVSLFTPALEPTPATYGRVDESATAAVNRLKPQLKLLLANKVLKALTTTVSDLFVSGEIFAGGSGVSVPISGSLSSGDRLTSTDVRPFKAGEDIQIRWRTKPKTRRFI